MPAPERDPIGKVCLLLNALMSERGLTYEEAARRMNVDVPRAREIVRQCGREVAWLRIDKSRRRHVLRLKGVGVTDATLEIGIAACLGASVSTLFEGTRYHKGMRDVVQFVVATNPRPERFADLDRRFVFLAGGGEAAFDQRAQMLDQVARAVLDGHPITFEYQSFDAEMPREERAEPWAIAIHKHRLYVIGRARNGSPWVWRFARMAAVNTIKRQRFEYPSKQIFNPNELFAESFGIWLQPSRKAVTVEVALSVKWRAYAGAHRWHASQLPPTQLPDGRPLIRLKVKICRELKEWIFGFGRDAEVVRPKALRDEIERELCEATENYRADAVGPRALTALEPPSSDRRGRQKRG